MSVHFGSSVYRFTPNAQNIGALYDFPEQQGLTPRNRVPDKDTSRFERHFDGHGAGAITVYDQSGAHPLMKFITTKDADKVTVIVDDDQFERTPMSVDSGRGVETVTADQANLFLRAWLEENGVGRGDVEVNREQYKALNLEDTRRELNRPWWEKV